MKITFGVICILTIYDFLGGGGHIHLAGSVIIFVSRKAAVDELATNLQQAGFPSKDIASFWSGG
jgi:hypothetical protein